MTDLPSKEVFIAVEEGQRLRGWIANGYAQVEYLLGDIITRSSRFEEYATIAARLPHRIEKRITRVRQILEVGGYFAQYCDELNWIIEAFEAHHQVRNLLAHGFCIAYHAPDGDFGLEFRKWHRDGADDVELTQTFRLVDLEYQRLQLAHISQRALKLAFAIHDDLGLVGP